MDDGPENESGPSLASSTATLAAAFSYSDEATEELSAAADPRGGATDGTETGTESGQPAATHATPATAVEIDLDADTAGLPADASESQTPGPVRVFRTQEELDAFLADQTKQARLAQSESDRLLAIERKKTLALERARGALYHKAGTEEIDQDTVLSEFQRAEQFTEQEALAAQAASAREREATDHSERLQSTEAENALLRGRAALRDEADRLGERIQSELGVKVKSLDAALAKEFKKPEYRWLLDASHDAPTPEHRAAARGEAYAKAGLAIFARVQQAAPVLKAAQGAQVPETSESIAGGSPTAGRPLEHIRTSRDALSLGYADSR